MTRKKIEPTSDDNVWGSRAIAGVLRARTEQAVSRACRKGEIPGAKKIGGVWVCSRRVLETLARADAINFDERLDQAQALLIAMERSLAALERRLEAAEAFKAAGERPPAPEEPVEAVEAVP